MQRHKKEGLAVTASRSHAGAWERDVELQRGNEIDINKSRKCKIIYTKISNAEIKTAIIILNGYIKYLKNRKEHE